MKLHKIVMLAALSSLAVGCQSVDGLASKFSKEPPAQQPAQQITFSDVLSKSQGDPLKGKTVAEMEGMFDATLPRFPFVTMDGMPLFVYGESNGSTKALLVKKDGTVASEKFSGYQLKRAVLNSQILYIGYKGDSVIKLNTDSFHYSEVDKVEMDRSRAVTDEFKLPDKEQAVHSQEGFLYTDNGFIFDLKKHDYLDPKDKRKFYEKADFGYGSYLFEIEPRLDQAVNLKVIKAKGDKTEKGKSYPIHLDLPNGYDVKNLSFKIGLDGKLFVFAPGVEEKGKFIIKLFEVPLDTFKE